MRVRCILHDAWTIAVKDATEMWRDGRFSWASATLLVVLTVAFATGWSRARDLSQARADAQRAEREMSLDKGDLNPHAAAHYGAFVFKPVEPLSAIDPGLDPFLGVSIFLEAHQQELAQHQPAADASPIRRFGQLTAAMALQVLTPLLIVLATAPALAGEREQGTLRQLASVGVPRASLALGKVLGAVFPLACVLVPASAVGVATMLWATPLGLGPDSAARGAWLVAVYLAYFAIWTAIGLLVSSRASSTMASLTILLIVWFAGAFLAPPLAILASKASDRALSSGEFVQALQRARAELPRWDRRVESVEERYLSGELDLEPGMPLNPEVIALVEAEAEETALFDAHFDRLFATYDRQADRYARWGALLPTIAVQTLSMALSGTDYQHHHRFLEATSRYRREFLETLNVELASYQNLDTFDYARGREFWERMPQFAYDAPEPAAVLREQVSSLGSIAAWLLAIGVALGWSLSTLRAT